MRTTVLVLALVGSALCCVFGCWWVQDWYEASDNVRLSERIQESLNRRSFFELRTLEGARREVERIQSRTRTFPFLLASSVLGLVGAGLSQQRRSTLASITLLIAAVGPVIIYGHPELLFPTFALALGGLFACFLPPERPHLSSESNSRTGSSQRRAREEDFDDDDFEE